MKSHLRRSAQLALALSLAARGFPVFPVSCKSKRPCNEHGHLEATTDPITIRAWWSKWPDALVAVATGARTRLWVLDVDGDVGRRSLGELLALLDLEQMRDLTPVVGKSAGGGLHLYFSQLSGQAPRTRASDIAPGLDTRGEGGYIIAPGNCLPDGREYRLTGLCQDLADASPAPQALVYLATFNRGERAEILAEPSLRSAIRDTEPEKWPGIVAEHRQLKAKRISCRSLPADADGMRRQALHDLRQEASSYATLSDGRRNGLFSVACRLVRYVAHTVLSEAELRAALWDAATANSAIGVHGRRWFDDVIRRALAYGERDALPLLARRFREGS